MNDLGISPDRLWRKVYWRTIPILGIAYVCSAIDRASLGYVAVPLSSDLRLSAADIGFAAGLVYLGYIVVPVPGNLVQHRIGARTWITSLLILWSLVTAATTVVDSATALYLARIGLGFAEGALPAGILFHLTAWIPRSRQPRVLPYLFLSAPVASITGALLASFLLSHGGLVFGLAAWRSVFLTEGILSLLIAVLTWFTLPGQPQDVSWLTNGERQMVLAELDRDAAPALAAVPASARAPFRDRRVWALAVAFFAIVFAQSPLAYFLPRMITVAERGLHNSQAVLITIVPQLIAAAVMIAWGRLGRRRSPVVATVIPVTAAAGAMAVAAYASNAVVFVGAVCIALAGSYSAVPQFWRLPPLWLSGLAAATGIALFNSAGYFSTFVAPYATGYAEDVTGNFRDALLLITAVMAVGVLTLAFASRRISPARPAGDPGRPEPARSAAGGESRCRAW